MLLLWCGSTYCSAGGPLSFGCACVGLQGFAGIVFTNWQPNECHDPVLNTRGVWYVSFVQQYYYYYWLGLMCAVEIASITYICKHKEICKAQCANHSNCICRSHTYRCEEHEKNNFHSMQKSMLDFYNSGSSPLTWLWDAWLTFSTLTWQHTQAWTILRVLMMSGLICVRRLAHPQRTFCPTHFKAYLCRKSQTNITQVCLNDV